MLQTLVSESHQLVRLVENLLDMARLESGSLALNRQFLDAMKDVRDRGFTFLNAKGPKEDLALTFSELQAETARRAHHLKTLGLQRGDRVALVSDPS